MLRRPLAEGRAEVAAIDHSHSYTPASPPELEEDRRRHHLFIRRLVQGPTCQASSSGLRSRTRTLLACLSLVWPFSEGGA